MEYSSVNLISFNLGNIMGLIMESKSHLKMLGIKGRYYLEVFRKE